MTKTQLMLTGLIAGTMALGTACSSGMSAKRMEPASSSQMGTGGAGQGQEQKPGESNGVYDDYSVPQEDRGSTGGSGYQDAVTNPDSIGTSNSKDEDVRDQDPKMDPGTGGSGYEEDSDMFKQHEEMGGNRFPGDKAVPQNL